MTCVILKLFLFLTRLIRFLLSWISRFSLLYVISYGYFHRQPSISLYFIQWGYKIVESMDHESSNQHGILSSPPQPATTYPFMGWHQFSYHLESLHSKIKNKKNRYCNEIQAGCSWASFRDRYLEIWFEDYLPYDWVWFILFFNFLVCVFF